MRCLRALLVALVVLALAEAFLATSQPPPDRRPLPWRGLQLFPWGSTAAPGVHRTRLGQLVAEKRPPGRLRIAVFGSSAVEGLGATLYHAFPWRLQRRLEQRGLDAEVLNLGLAGRDSGHHRGAVLRALRELDPSVVVVYAGNNELLRLRAYKHLDPGWSAGSEAVRARLEGLALYRFLAERLARKVQAPDGPRVDDIPGNVTAADRELATRFYRRNLEGIAQACAEAGVPLLLCTLATNDLAPPDYGRPPGQPAHPAHRHHAAGMQALQRGDLRAAAAELELARELDPAPQRALPSWNRTVREVAAEQRVALGDVEVALRRASPTGLLDNRVFFDHCHLNLQGLDQAAAALEEGLQAAGLLPPVRPPPRVADTDGLESLPMDPLPPDYRAVVRYLQGFTEEEHAALVALEAAVRRRPEERALWRDLARVCVRAGRLPEARAACGRYLEAGGWDPAVARDLELLGK